MSAREKLEETRRRVEEAEERLDELAEKMEHEKQELSGESAPPKSAAPPKDFNQGSPLPGLG